MKKALASYCITNVVLVLFIILMSACSDGQTRYRIGVSQCSDDEWRSQMNDEIKREMLFHDDAEVEIRTSNDNDEKQIEDLEYFIDNKFDIIIVSPREARSIGPVIRRAYESGIPVIVFDRAVDGNYFTSFLELDNLGIGRAAAQYALQSSDGKDARIIEIRGLDDSSPAIDRHRGFCQIIDSAENASVVASESGMWRKEPAYRITDSLLNIYPDVSLIYAHNDVMALGAAEAIRKHGRNDIKILGTDAAPALGIKAVADSMIDATFVYPTEGERIIKTAMAILKGGTYNRIDHISAMYAVDSTNADILLRQNELLCDRTHKMELLNDRNTIIKSRHSAQTTILIVVAIAAVLLVAIVAVMVFHLRQRGRFEKILKDKNAQLQEERDRQDVLYNQLEDATSSKLVFFTNVSHDLRTPLTLISEPIEQVAQATYLSPVHRSLMQMALRNLKILRRMIEQILDFRRYQNGKTELYLHEACPARLLGEWADAFRSVAAKRQMKFSVDIDIPDKFSMALDVDKLERAFFNIVSNAFKYTGDKGSISISCKIEESVLKIIVADSGIGISEEDRSHIFDRFYRVDKQSSTGSGIGLSLTKAFIDVMGGGIEVESELGKGSRFIVTIPVSHIDEEPAEDPYLKEKDDLEQDVISELLPVESDFASLSDDRPLVLVIDDNPDILTLLQGILADSYDIITAQDGRSGLKIALKYVPDLIICDIMMPVMDGLEFCRHVKNEISTSHIPILMLTACKLDEQRVQSYDSGADSFISKPFSAPLVRSRVLNLILNRKRIRNLYADSDAATVSDTSGMTSRRNLPETNDPNAVESEFYRDFISVITENYKNSEMTVKDVADRLGIGPTQLTRKIKTLTNLSPVDIIRNVRLRTARKLILTTDMSISEIAYEVGFSSPQYFSKCFRDAFSVSPTDLRAGS